MTAERTLQKQRAKKDAFLEAYARLGTITQAAHAAGIDRTSHYRWLSEDRDYGRRVSEAEEAAVDALEAEARRRAIGGSDVLLIFLMKGARPGKYRERVDVTLDVRREIERLTTDPVEREAAIAEAERIIAGSR